MTRSILTANYIAETCRLSVQALPDIFEKYGVFKHDESGCKIGQPGPGHEYFRRRFPDLGLPQELRKQENYDNPWVANWVFHNTSISRIDFESGAHNVVYLNKIDHLAPQLVTW